MNKIIKLDDLRPVLLATAAQRKTGNLLPAPESIGHQASRMRKAIPGLLRRRLVEEVPVTDAGTAWREQEGRPIGLVITDPGCKMIGAGDIVTPSDEGEVVPPVASLSPPASKITHVIALLSRKEGATLDELTDMTGWQPHSTRSALTGLRKKGLRVERGKRGDVTCYRIIASA